MNRIMLGTLLALSGPLAAQAGCLTGAAVGGVAGHAVHHGVLGAAAGCAVGHHHSVMQQRQNAQPSSGTTNQDAQPSSGSTTTH